MYDTTGDQQEKSVAVRVGVVVGLVVLILALIGALVMWGAPDRHPGARAVDPSPTPSTQSTGDSSGGADEVGSGGGDGEGADSDGSDSDGSNGGGTDGGGTDGGTDGGGTDGGGDVAPSAVDCVGYNPSNLSVESAGADGWLMVDGGHSLALFDTEADANDGVKVARNYTKSCFIGRDNHRSERSRYIVRYWAGPSGLPLGPAPALDCVGYNPSNLTVEEYGTAGWRLVDGGHSMLLLDTAGDAERAKLVAAEHSKLCFIGRDNHRSDRYRYIFEFWLG